MCCSNALPLVSIHLLDRGLGDLEMCIRNGVIDSIQAFPMYGTVWGCFGFKAKGRQHEKQNKVVKSKLNMSGKALHSLVLTVICLFNY